jgi:sec-independent protein translocase protein TatA
MLQNIGTVEIIVIAVVLMLLFGSKKLPELARGVRKSGEEFNKGLKDESTTAKTEKTDKE